MNNSVGVEAPLKILVVEDDPVYAEFVVMSLRGAGHEVATAATGAEARTRASGDAPDAVVLDLSLPDESGYDLARALRGGVLPAESIIILLTANLYPERDTAEAVGIDMVLTKPVEASLVAGMVDLIRTQRRRRLAARG